MFESQATPANHATDRFRGLLFNGRQNLLGAKPRRSVADRAVALPAIAAKSGFPRVGTVEELALIKEVIRRSGLQAEAYRLEPLLRRVPACLRALRTQDAAAALDLVENHPPASEVALGALLIGTTGFFRDPAVFSRLEEAIIPEICSRVANPRIWSAACSDGSELCSVAMLVAGQGALDRTEFLGSDCRESAIAQARRGSLPSPAAGTVDAGRMESFFARGAQSLWLRPELAARLQWQCSDVLQQQPAGLWDLILCRNLAIYLESGAMAALWRRLEEALAPGGCLVVGRAEKPHLPGLRRVAPCLYRENRLPIESHD